MTGFITAFDYDCNEMQLVVFRNVCIVYFLTILTAV